MCRIETIASGVIDNRDSAYPQAVAMPNGDILCSFSVGGGPHVNGGTDLARSCDGGQTWSLQGTILPATTSPRSTNALKLSLTADGKTLYAYGTQFFRHQNQKFGEGRRIAVLCRSDDNGVSWSDAKPVPMPESCPLEVSHSVLPLASGRLLAPAGALPSKDRLGERVFVAISDDGGLSWPRHAVVFEDPRRKLGFFEHKLAEIAPQAILATAWTVTLGDVCDRPNSYALSKDNGQTWSPFRSTGIRGQTMTAIPIDDNRLLVLYNRRHGHQGIVAALVLFTVDGWSVQHECLLYDATNRNTIEVRPANAPDPTDGQPETSPSASIGGSTGQVGINKLAGPETGLDAFDTFAFGFPTAIRLKDGTFFATYWCGRSGHSECRWAKLAVHWPS